MGQWGRCPAGQGPVPHWACLGGLVDTSSSLPTGFWRVSRPLRQGQKAGPEDRTWVRGSGQAVEPRRRKGRGSGAPARAPRGYSALYFKEVRPVSDQGSFHLCHGWAPPFLASDRARGVGEYDVGGPESWVLEPGLCRIGGPWIPSQQAGALVLDVSGSREGDAGGFPCLVFPFNKAGSGPTFPEPFSD